MPTILYVDHYDYLISLLTGIDISLNSPLYIMFPIKVNYWFTCISIVIVDSKLIFSRDILLSASDSSDKR